MDHWRSHIPKNNPPKQFCEWSFEQGDRKWQQDELELVLELVGDFFLEEEGVCGCKNKWRGPTSGPRGRGHALHPRGHTKGPPDVFLVPIFLKYSGKKSYFIFRAFGELLFSRYFYCKDNSENRQKILFLLYLI